MISRNRDFVLSQSLVRGVQQVVASEDYGVKLLDVFGLLHVLVHLLGEVHEFGGFANV